MSANRKRKRDIQDCSFDIGCGIGLKRRKKTPPHPPISRKEKENLTPFKKPLSSWRPPRPITPVFTPPALKRRNSFKCTLQRRVSMNVMKKKMKKLQDYSLPSTRLKTCGVAGYCSPVCVSCRVKKDHDLQQKIDHEIKMREGTTKLLAASKHPAQLLEAARNLLTSNHRIMAYMSELQKRKTAQVLGRQTSVEGNQVPCTARVCVTDLRIPLMWKDTDHFKNKGDYRRYAVFCLVKIDSDIYDTSMINNVDRSMTDLTFDDTLVFENVPHDFECKVEIFCHKLHEDLTIASTPKKLKKKINDLSGSVGRSVGKRLSGLHDTDIIGNMVLGPRFDMVAQGTMTLLGVNDSVGTFDLVVEPVSDSNSSCELPLFGHYCCRIVAQPLSLINPVHVGYLNLQEDDDLAKWKRYWCVLKNLKLDFWSSSDDVEVTEPLVTIPITKNTQISSADPSRIKRSHMFHVRTCERDSFGLFTMATDNQEELTKWWDALQQHLLDQVLWKQACDHVMDIPSPSPSKRKPSFLRKSSIYDDTPISDSSSRSSISSDIKLEDDQLNEMLSTLMGEAKQIRGDNPSTSTS
ncbi:rhotekin-like isoform X1 [Mytilus galloprovincialis]|uniref:rhotekin-like isoform X1 n=1 Tax=Mytilus galloprovincialis TaxID=29158 RepID=UPI003F7C6ECE